MSECPCCGEGYDVRVPREYDHIIRCGRHYRCRGSGYTYLHEIPTKQAATVPYP